MPGPIAENRRRNAQYENISVRRRSNGVGCIAEDEGRGNGRRFVLKPFLRASIIIIIIIIVIT